MGKKKQTKKAEKAQQKQTKKLKQVQGEEEKNNDSNIEVNSGGSTSKKAQKGKENKRASSDKGTSKVEELKKKIKRTMSNMSDAADVKNDGTEIEKQDPLLNGNVISFGFAGNNEEEIIVNIQKRSYSFNTNSDFVKENQPLLDFIESIDGYCKLLQEKEQRKSAEIQKITQYYQFTAIEYYLLKSVDQIKAKERNLQEQKDKDASIHSQDKPPVQDTKDQPPVQDTKDKSDTKKNKVPAENVFEDEKCCICQFELYEDIKSFSQEKFKKQLEQDEDQDAIGLSDCDGHYFHLECLKMMVKSTYIKCPICSKIYGVMIGDQPDGDMTVEVIKQKCDGFSCKTIVINYDMHGGQINGKYISGTWRTAYLPDNNEGREIRDLLQIAFDRKLIFTVGRSVTTGMDNQIVWNGIHHKTNLSGGSSHFGWPDPTYFTRVKEELALKGVR